MAFRRLLAALVLVATVLPLSVGNAAPAPDDPVTLRGASRFTTTEPRSVLVRFPRTIDVSDLGLDYAPVGRVSGLVLTKVGHYPDESQRPVLEDVTIGRCSVRGCKARRGMRVQFGFNVFKLEGIWRLTIIADSAPVTATVRLKGVPGTSLTRLRTPAAAEIRTLKPTLWSKDGNQVVSAGGFSDVTRSDFGMVGLWLEGKRHVASGYGACMYEHRPPYPNEAAFAPGCPLGGRYNATEYGKGGRAGVVFSVGNLNRTDGLGAWYSTTADVSRYGAVALWLDVHE
jgi:hypothetical protein